MGVYKLKTPIAEEDIRKLVVNDTIYLTGTMVTARDQAHRRALEYFKQGKPLPINLKGLALFHCGPVIKKKDGEWMVISAGPTTSTRMEIFEDEFIKNFGVRVIIGKGGMGSRTAEAMKEYGAVYGAFTGGAGALAAKAIKGVKSVEWVDLGMPEAMWIFEVEDFGPLIVAIDSHGNNIFKSVQEEVKANKQRIYERLGIE